MESKVPDVDDSSIVSEQLAMVERIIARRLTDPDPKRKESALSVIRYMTYSVRMSMLPHGNGIGNLWKWIRKFEDNTEFVLDFFTEYRFRGPKSDDQFKRLVSQLATSLTDINSGEKGAVDATITDRMDSQSAVKDKLLANPWIVPLILITYSDMLMELLNVAKDTK